MYQLTYYVYSRAIIQILPIHYSNNLHMLMYYTYTTHTEMLVNPYAEYSGTVAKPSRKTDMYVYSVYAYVHYTCMYVV